MQRINWQTAGLAAMVMLALAAAPAAAQETASEADRAKELAKDAGIAGPEEAPQGLYGSMKALWNNLYELGGRTMVFLAIASIVALASVLERAISLIIAAISVHGPLKPARAMWTRGDFDSLGRMLQTKRGITARLIDFIVRHREYHVADVSAGVGDLASRYIRRQIRRNYPLAVVATIAPLLGLLGTIIGMIEAFEKVNIAGSMGSAEYLSGAISKALVTTEGGLMIAIPALFFYHLYKFLTGVLADTLEGKANEMVTGWLMRKEAA